MADEQEQPDECFIVGVIGKVGSEQRIHADWFFEGIIRPLFTDHYPNFRVLRADHMKMPGIITSQIIEKLLNVRLVIADLTFLNPNAFYEIGIRHMTGKPVVHVHRAGESIPFDISTFLSLEYSVLQHAEMVAARANLKVLVDNVLVPDHKMENPVTQAQGRAQFDVTATAPDRLLLSQIEALGARVAAIEAPRNAPGFGPPRMASPSLFGAKAPRFAGGGEALPIDSVTFSAQPQTTMEQLDQFISDFVAPYQNNGVTLRKMSNSYVANYDKHTLAAKTVSNWLRIAEECGIDAIEF